MNVELIAVNGYVDDSVTTLQRFSSSFFDQVGFAK